MKLTLPVPPMGKPRQTQRDKWKRRPVVVRYRKWCDAVRMFAMKEDFTFPESGAHLLFRVQMPKSWSKKKKRELCGQPHQQKPDVDNLAKAVLDALCPDDDSHIWQLTAEKRWAETGSIEITLEPQQAEAA